ncbi:MAG: hypothetical protein APR63_11270 [Desulfuromonas sp. SDB]|nr:MAG: hypothetical protein APR63_11270 [Desulfuromonas sp. SDB]
MSYKQGKLWIIYNGEIYNYLELREQLRSKGYTFKTQTDTEVVLAAYDYWGANCTRHFNGDWAYALYDLEKNQIILSVDRVGVKSLYFAQDGNCLIFASEIKALYNINSLIPEPNYESLSIYLLTSLHDFSNETMVKNIYKAKPSYNVIINLKTRKILNIKYWQKHLNIRNVKFSNSKADIYANDIYNILHHAVKIRLRSDVNIGSCLSGGLDSSIVVALINKNLKNQHILDPLQLTFSATYPNYPKIDETKWIDLITYNKEIKNYKVNPKINEFLNDLDDLIYCQDEPFASTSIYAQYKVMKEASKFVKVLLDGQGADELFAGYKIYYANYLREGNYLDILKKVNLVPTKELIGDILILVKISTLIEILKVQKFHKYLSNIIYNKKIKKIPPLTSEFNQVMKNNIFSRYFKRYQKSLNSLLFLDEFFFKLPHLLRYEDRNSMKWSVESRTPFTDYRLIEYALSIPAAYKIHHGYNKWILRYAFRDIIPRNIITRNDKIGFETPEHIWLKKILSCLEIKKGSKINHFAWRYYNCCRFIENLQ